MSDKDHTISARTKKSRPPFDGRKVGERTVKKLAPPFHPKNKDIKDYKS